MRAMPIIELRQYTMRPGYRDSLIGLFDAHFVEGQESVGMQVIGQFRDLDDPDRFVWLRGFPDMTARAHSLAEFYDGPVWQSHRSAANATIVDNDNVLLLRPAWTGAGVGVDSHRVHPRDSHDAGTGIVIANIYHIDPTPEKETEFVDLFTQRVAPLLQAAGIVVRAAFTVVRHPNTYPRLPVREGEYVFTWMASFADVAAHERAAAALAQLEAWRDDVGLLLRSKIREPQTLRLSPTARSLLHG